MINLRAGGVPKGEDFSAVGLDNLLLHIVYIQIFKVFILIIFLLADLSQL